MPAWSLVCCSFRSTIAYWFLNCRSMSVKESPPFWFPITSSFMCFNSTSSFMCFNSNTKASYTRKRTQQLTASTFKTYLHRVVPVAASNLGRTNHQKDEGAFVDNLMHVDESGFIGTERERAEAPNAMYVCLCWNTSFFFFSWALYRFFFSFVFSLLCPSLTMIS